MNANKIKEMADQLDCIFYFLILPYNGENKQIKSEIEEAICKKIKDRIGVNFYAIRSGTGTIHVSDLSEETRLLIPEQVNFILVDVANDDVSLLSQRERDMFLERLRSDKNSDALSAVIAQQICNQTESER